MRGRIPTSTTNDNNTWSHLAIGTMIESGNEFKGVVCGEKTLKNRNRVRWGENVEWFLFVLGAPLETGEQSTEVWFKPGSTLYRRRSKLHESSSPEDPL